MTKQYLITMNDYQANASKTARTSDDPMMLANWALGLSGEAGEVVELIKKALFHGKELDKEKVAKELGDVLWYVSALSTQLGLNMNDIAEANLRKLAERYPEGFVLGGGKRD